MSGSHIEQPPTPMLDLLFKENQPKAIIERQQAIMERQQEEISGLQARNTELQNDFDELAMRYEWCITKNAKYVIRNRKLLVQLQVMHDAFSEDMYIEPLRELESVIESEAQRKEEMK